jgi:hypothetical protein
MSNNTVDTRIEEVDNLDEEYKLQIRDLQRKVQEVYSKQRQNSLLKKALTSYKNAEPQPAEQVQPSQQARRKFDPISPEVRALVAQNILYTGNMTWDQAMKAYRISRASISRILNEETVRHWISLSI